MRRQIVKRPEVRRDLQGQFSYIARDKLSAANRFLRAFDQTIKRLARAPERGTAWETNNPDWTGLRVMPVKGFENHLIFYFPVEGGIEIVRVLHGARDIEVIFGD
jgi:toxin ParE1/3/4